MFLRLFFLASLVLPNFGCDSETAIFQSDVDYQVSPQDCEAKLKDYALVEDTSYFEQGVFIPDGAEIELSSIENTTFLEFRSLDSDGIYNQTSDNGQLFRKHFDPEFYQTIATRIQNIKNKRIPLASNNEVGGFLLYFPSEGAFSATFYICDELRMILSEDDLGRLKIVREPTSGHLVRGTIYTK
ncbi:hypothetical protein ACFO4O_09910 [Glaciecola siphonariae]|uniref:Lipoprotein n=1 Tax=Glaciecola siphonariae TaxID=521012 RepID=A0ABV9LYI9_9ALTE